MAFRNARAHREKDENLMHQYREFLLINELYLLEAEAITCVIHRDRFNLAISKSIL